MNIVYIVYLVQYQSQYLVRSVGMRPDDVSTICIILIYACSYLMQRTSIDIDIAVHEDTCVHVRIYSIAYLEKKKKGSQIFDDCERIRVYGTPALNKPKDTNLD